jgi:PBP4 family serine-type D-alanyl-D-alanine carboxypeptidase
VTGDVRVVRDPQESILAQGTAPGGLGERPPRIISHLVSPPLLEILRVVNKESNNLLAETVGKTLGRVTLGDGSFQGGTRAVARFLSRDVGLSPEGVTLRDGSGLSARNLVSASGLVQLLAFMADSPDWEDFWSTLPEAGVRRELGRMSGSPAARNLRAKTGTMHGVSALSGMVRTRSGERVLFSMIANDMPSERRAKRVEDQVGIGLASITRPIETQPPDRP